MRSQRSIGYVHSSAFVSEEEAEREMRAYQGGNTDDCASRIVRFQSGKRFRHWEKNCIALGLSGGFVEPLESTGLYLSDLGAVALAEHFPFDSDHMEAMAYRYNRVMSNRYYEILDFINMHYCMTQRTDTEFWKTVQQSEHITDRLQAKLAFWKMKPPSSFDFEDQSFPGLSQQAMAADQSGADRRAAVDTAGLWNHESYECILYGMDFLKQEYNEKLGENRPKTQVHPHILERLQAASQKLPPHDVWLRQYLGMQDYATADKPAGWVA